MHKLMTHACRRIKDGSHFPTLFALSAAIGIITPCTSLAWLFGGGGRDEYFPQGVQRGYPVVAEVVLYSYGPGAGAKVQYGNILLRCRPPEGPDRVIPPQAAELPENYKIAVAAAKKAKEEKSWQAFIFTTPPFADQEITCHVEMTFNGYKQDAVDHVIKIIPAAKSNNDHASSRPDEKSKDLH